MRRSTAAFSSSSKPPGWLVVHTHFSPPAQATAARSGYETSSAVCTRRRRHKIPAATHFTRALFVASSEESAGDRLARRRTSNVLLDIRERVRLRDLDVVDLRKREESVAHELEELSRCQSFRRQTEDGHRAL